MLSSSSETAATACSMPRLRAIGLAPAATLRRPSRTIAWASTVAVVVPSPATSSVFLATSLTSSAPIFSYGSSSSISLAMLTPSLVMVGAPHFFSRTTLRPFGPRVTLTASARMFIPRSRPRRASSSKAMILAIRVVPPTRNGWVTGWRPRRTDRIRRAPFARVLQPSPDSRNYHSHGESANPMISTRPPRVQMPDQYAGWSPQVARPILAQEAKLSDLDAQPSSRAGPLTSSAKAVQTLDQHRVGLHGRRVVDQGVEHLVVPRGTHVEQLPDGLLLGSGVLPPLTLEGDNLAVAVTQLAQRRGLDLCHGVHLALLVASLNINLSDQMTLMSFAGRNPLDTQSHRPHKPHRCSTSGHRVQDRGDVILGGRGIEEGKTSDRLTLVRGRHHKGELLAQHLIAPSLIVLGPPTMPAEDHHGQVGLAQLLKIRASGDLSLGEPRHLQRSLDRLRVGPGPVSGQREPQRQPASPTGEPDRVLGRVPLRIVEHVQIRRLLGVGPASEGGLTIQEGAAVERREQPLVRVDDEGVGVLDPVKEVTNRWGGQTRPAVGAVDVDPDAELSADLRHGVEVVDDAEVRGARRCDDGKEGLGSLGLQDLTQVVPAQSLVLVAANADELGVHHLARGPDRGVGPQLGRHLRGSRSGETCLRMRCPRRPPRGHQRRQVADRATGDEHASGSCRQPSQVSDPAQCGVLGIDRT